MGLCNSIFLCRNIDVEFYPPRELEAKCKLAVIRIEARDRTAKNMFRKMRNDIKEHLLNGEDGMAFDVAERMVLDEYTRKAEKALMRSCAYVGRNYGMVARGACLDDKMKKMLFTLVWAAPRLKVSELHWIRRAVTEWYGEDIDYRILTNADNYVNPQVIELLDTAVPKEDSILYIVNSVCSELGINPPVDPDNSGESDVMTITSPLPTEEPTEVTYEADDESGCYEEDGDESMTERNEKDECPEEACEDADDWMSVFKGRVVGGEDGDDGDDGDGTSSLIISDDPVMSVVDDMEGTA